LQLVTSLVLPVLDPAMYRRRHVIFGVVALVILMASIDSTIITVAIPTIRADLHTNIIWTGWTVAGYQLGQLLVMPLAGKLSDEWGRRRVFLGSLTIFTVASCLCGLAPNIYVLVGMRVVQAVGGGAMTPSCTGIVSDLYRENRMRAIGLFTSIFPMGAILGPNLGGFLVDNFSWRFVFYVNVPLGIIAVVATLLLYKERGVAFGSTAVDWAGSVAYASAILLLLLAATWVGEDTSHLRSPIIWMMAALAVGAGVYFFRHEARFPNPIVAPDLLRLRPLVAANLYNLIFGMGNFGVLAFFPTFFEERYGFSPTLAGFLLTPRAVMMVIVSIIASVYIIKFGYRIPMIAKCLLQAATLSLLSLGLTTVHLGPLVLGEVAWLSLLMVMTGTGLGIGQPASNNAALDILPGKIASAAGVRNMFRLTGGLIGTSMVSVTLALYGRAHEVTGLETVFNMLAVFNLVCIPIVFFIPDSARIRRRLSQEAAAEPVPADEVAQSAGD
jgi:EmrB/QacA subfamily drug resistance transporter